MSPRIAAVIGICVLLNLRGSLPAPADASRSSATSVTLSKIWTKWREQQSNAERVRIRWTTKVLIANPLSGPGRALSDRNGGAPTAASKQVKLHPSESALTISGGQVRYEARIPSFVGNDGGSTISSISAFDGTLQQYLSDRSGRPESQNHGTVGEKAAFDEWRNVHLLPLVCVLRPLRDEAFGRDSQQWLLQPGERLVDGRRCVLITGKDETIPAGTSSTINAYLDPQRGYVPLRIVHFVNGKVSVKLEMAYADTRDGLWVPNFWKVEMRSPNGSVSESSENRLLSVNKVRQISSDEFRIRFPAGTIVYDKRKNEEPFLVQSDGSMVPLRAPSQQPARRTWLIWGLALVSVVVVGGATLWFIWRNRRGKEGATE